MIKKKKQLTGTKIISNDKNSFDCSINLSEITLNTVIMMENALTDTINKNLKKLTVLEGKGANSKTHFQSFNRLIELRDLLRKEIILKFPMWTEFYNK
ncbi:MAG TPA: hypothetical protein VN026_03275 [Bacteroidia bacterium]|jgi:hypothetical protein|nr:hypothetical protein [Bacteroidia bacterium]